MDGSPNDSTDGNGAPGWTRIAVGLLWLVVVLAVVFGLGTAVDNFFGLDNPFALGIPAGLLWLVAIGAGSAAARLDREP